jgi:hypothetical protein
MALTTTYIDFTILDTYNNKTMGIADISYYSSAMISTGYTLQILVPGYEDPAELNYYPNGVTILNSNLLNITRVADQADLLDLPDGVYTIKMSICPFDNFWKERTFYRTSRLECKYSQALLTLDFSQCTDCFSTTKVQNLSLAKIYIEGVHANMVDCNLKKATELYQKANAILDNLLNCNCA